MDRKISISLLLSIFIVFYMLMSIHCFYLIPFPNVMNQIFNRFNSVGPGLLALLLFLLTISYKSNRFIDTFCAFVIFVFLITLFYSAICYGGQNFSQLIGGNSDILCILLCRPIYIICHKNNRNFNRILNIYLVISVIWFIILIIQDFLFLESETVILKQFFTNVSGVNVSLRTGESHLRLSLKFDFAIIICFYLLLNSMVNKNDRNILKIIFYFICFLICCYCLIVIQQSRAMIIASFLGCMGVFIFNGKNSKIKIFNSFLIIFFGLILFYSGFFNDFLNSFSSNADDLYSYSNSFRKYEYGIGWNYFLNNPLLGKGLFYGEIYDLQYYDATINRIIYVNDIGIVGVLASAGLVGFFVYILPIIKYLRDFFKHRCFNKYKGLTVGLLIAFIAMFVSFLEFGRRGGFEIAILVVCICISCEKEFYGVDQIG